MKNKKRKVKTKYKMFGETRTVEATIYNPNPNNDKYEETLWVERPETMYALSSKKYQNKPVLVIRREDWLKGNTV